LAIARPSPAEAPVIAIILAASWFILRNRHRLNADRPRRFSNIVGAEEEQIKSMVVDESIAVRPRAVPFYLEEPDMLKLALVFFLVSVVAGIFGFTNIAAGTATIAKWLFIIAIVIFAVLLVLGLMAGEALF
jgi:uncharacterized membrane protein YtjA (UPF0391 family)